MRFVRDKQGSASSSLPLTSMIDVFFLLLVYFLTNSVLTPTEEELAAALSAETESAAASDLEPQIIEIRADPASGAVYVVSGTQIRTQAELTGLLARLPKDSGVFVRASDEAPVWAVAAALQSCEDAGFERLTYVAPE